MNPETCHSLETAIAQAHTRISGIGAYPLDGDWEGSLPDWTATVERRSTALLQVRSDIVEFIETEYAAFDPDLVTSAQVFERIAPHIDRIFVAQMKRHADAGGVYRPLAWYDGQSCMDLRDTIRNVLSDLDVRFQQRNPHFCQTLELLQGDFLTGVDEAFLGNTLKQFEALAVASYRSAKPVLLVSAIQYYLNGAAHVREMECRLFQPVPEDELADLHTAWKYLLKFCPDKKDTPEPTGMFVRAVLGAGSQLISYTTAEALDRSFILAINH